jgi:hypothetical protein
MSKLQYIHFCGGFGAEAGKQLRFWELSAINTAAALHPEATIMLHTQAGSWDNAPYFAAVRFYSESERCGWKTWTAVHGAHQSDRVRLLALLEYGGLYQDTDSFMLKNCDELSGMAETGIPDQWTGKSLVNGFMYVGNDKSWLKQAYDAIDCYDGKIGWDNTSCKLYSKLLRKTKTGLTLLAPSLYTCVTWHARDRGKFFGVVTAEMLLRVAGASVAHAMSSGLNYAAKCSLMDNPPTDSVYEYILNRQKLICETSPYN